MNSLQLKCFLSAAQTLNFTATAEKLYFTPQAVSKNILNLEKELGASLFRREDRELSLTRAGEYCVRVFSKNADAFSKTLNETKNLYKMLSGSLRIGYSEWIDPFGEISRGIDSFRENSEASFSGRQYDNYTLLSELSMGNIDVALIPGDQVVEDSEFDVAPIATDNVCLVVPVSVCGEDWEGPFDPNCWGVPYIQTFAWNWSYLESRQIVGKQLRSLGICPTYLEFLPNIHSVYAELQTNPCVTIIETKFGYMRNLKNLKFFPLDGNSELYCVCRKLNENPLVNAFVGHMRGVYDMI